MNFVSVCLFIATLVLTTVYCLPEKYSSKYDAVDIDSILKNERLLQIHINCILDKGPCSAEGRDFRKYLPEALNSSCEKCTEPQKNMIRKAARYIMDNKEAEWQKIRDKYDPKGEHVDEFHKFMDME